MKPVTERLEARVPLPIKSLIDGAAALEGRSITDYVIATLLHAFVIRRAHDGSSRSRDAQTPAIPDHSRNPDWKTGPGCRRTRGGRAVAGRCVETDSSKCQRSGIRIGGRGSQRSIRCRILSEIWFHSLQGLSAETLSSDADDCRSRQVSRSTWAVVSSFGPSLTTLQPAGAASRYLKALCAHADSGPRNNQAADPSSPLHTQHVGWIHVKHGPHEFAPALCGFILIGTQFVGIAIQPQGDAAEFLWC